MKKDSTGWKMVVLVIVIVFGAFAAHWSAKAMEAFTADDITNRIESVTGMLVFVMDGCGYCKDLEDNVLSKLKGESDNILIVKRGTPDGDKLISKWDVRGFPTIYFLKKGEKMLPPGSGTHGEYVGPRDLDTIKGHLKTVLQGYS
jgi:thioredoxin-related protein